MIAKYKDYENIYRSMQITSNWYKAKDDYYKD